MAEVSMIFDWGKTESSDAIKVNFNKHPFNGIFSGILESTSRSPSSNSKSGLILFVHITAQEVKEKVSKSGLDNYY